MTDHEIRSLCDISVSSAVDRSVMGLLTSLGDLLSILTSRPILEPFNHSP